MTPFVVLTPAAELDLASAIEWYESKHIDLSYDFRLALDATLSLITRHPDAYAVVAPGMRRALLRRFPHAVYYRRHEALIEVVAILHPRRSPLVWQARSQ
jgi:plasmid stabilization system protein ParE